MGWLLAAGTAWTAPRAGAALPAVAKALARAKAQPVAMRGRRRVGTRLIDSTPSWVWRGEIMLDACRPSARSAVSRGPTGVDTTRRRVHERHLLVEASRGRSRCCAEIAHKSRFFVGDTTAICLESGRYRCHVLAFNPRHSPLLRPCTAGYLAAQATVRYLVTHGTWRRTQGGEPVATRRARVLRPSAAARRPALRGRTRARARLGRRDGHQRGDDLPAAVPAAPRRAGGDLLAGVALRPAAPLLRAHRGRQAGAGRIHRRMGEI